MKAMQSARGWASATLLLLTLAVTGCATGPQANPRDPLEPLNRTVYGFNDAVDRALLKPAATVYRDVTPGFVRQGVGNFFGNLGDVWSTVNNLLQLKGKAAAESAMRVSVNTVFGFVGIIDLATEIGIERRTEDFGQTLGHWGVGSGPYLMLPLLGPSTLRDTVARTVDIHGDLVGRETDISTRNSLKALELVDTRAGLLRASSVMEGAALDPYTFTRDFYLQRRLSDVYDGNPPEVTAPKTAP